MNQTSSTQLRKTIKLKIKKSTIPNKHHHHQSIPDLPPEILELIFNRVSLPIKTITEFQNPTNNNNNNSNQLSPIFSDPKFAESQTHLYTRPCILAYNNGCHNNKSFLIEGHHNQRFLSTEINLDFVRDDADNTTILRNLEILSSCNGLLLLTDRRSMRVVNPLTRETIHLPEPSNGGFYSGDKSYYAMGYSPKSDTYKVVRIVGVLRQPVGGYYLEFCWRAEVLTLGTKTNDTWRKIDGCDLVLQSAIMEEEGHHVMIKGALYWLTHIGHRQEIVRFAIDSEEFVLLSSPLDEEGLGFGYSLSSLGVVDDDVLCVARYQRTRFSRHSDNVVSSGHGTMELSVLRDCGAWEKIGVICTKRVRFDMRFELVKASESDEEVLLMMQDPLKLVYYDTKKHTAREAQIDGFDYSCKMMKGVVFGPNLKSITKCVKA